MKTRGVLVQGGLAVLGLVAAYTTWQRPAERPAADVTVLDVPAHQLSRLRYENGKRWVELRRDGEGLVAVLGATDAVWPLGANPDAPLPDGGAVQPLVPAVPERTLRASEAAARLFGRVAPLKASRALGTLEGPELAEVGLEDSTQRLVLTVGGQERIFQVSSSVLGLNSPYLRSEGDGRVFLLGPGLLSELDAASARLVDRRLHAFRPTDFDALTVVRGEARRTFAQRTEGHTARLFPQETPEAADERATTWHDRLWRSAPTELLGRGESPPGGEPRVELRLEYAQGGEPLGWLELGAADGKVYARSEHTTGWVALSTAALPLLDEASLVVTPP